MKSFTWDFHRLCHDIVRAAIQETWLRSGFPVTTAVTVAFFADVVSQLKKKGANDIAVFGGGGGTMTHDDARQMKRKGVDEIFFAGTSLNRNGPSNVKKALRQKEKSAACNQSARSGLAR